ncbi:hypothetical protein FKM82_023105 [Ascaphus truei]
MSPKPKPKWLRPHFQPSQQPFCDASSRRCGEEDHGLSESSILYIISLWAVCELCATLLWSYSFIFWPCSSISRSLFALHLVLGFVYRGHREVP